MAEKTHPHSLLLTIESVAISAFFIFFISWSMRKCSEESYLRQNTSNKFHLERARDSMAKANRENKVVEETPTEEELSDSKENTETEAPEKEADITAATGEKKAKPEPERQSFKVVADGTNLREKPSINARSLGKLNRNETLTFMNETVKEKQKINTGGGNKSGGQFWYKVKTKKGTVGWVFGPGLKR